jgi:hypothetical protein
LIRNRELAAWTSFVRLVADAHRVALEMYGGPYDFRIAHVETTAPFDSACMLAARDVQVTGTIYGTVALTPIIYFCNTRTSDLVAPELVCPAKVLVK